MKTLEFKAYDILQKYNFSKEDAEALIEYMKEASKEEVATKKDVEQIYKRFDSIDHEFNMIRAEIKISINETKSSIIQWICGLLIGQMAVIFSILKLTGAI
ncbi:MAG: hypothetical protein SFY32_14830 [Bacteroidota bacterium]|nr:hypothetical protein [Bacteroidota bacterium]